MATKKVNSPKKKKTSVAKPKTTVEKPVASTKNVAAQGGYKAFVAFINETPIVGKLAAEFIGTFLFTTSFLEMQSNPLYVAFALIGITLMVSGVSGAHVNPAVTVGAWVTRKIRSLEALGYLAAQFLGSGAAWLMLNAFIKGNGMTTSSMYHAASITSGKEWYLFFAEFVGASILTLGIATALQYKKRKSASAFAAGFAIMIALYVSMSLSTVLLTESYTGFTFLNPAVAFAANGLSWKLWPLMIFVIAPALGGIVGFGIQKFLHSQDQSCDCEVCAK